MQKNSAIQKIRKLLSRKKKVATNTDALKETTSQVIPLKLLSRTSEVTMAQFIACLCHNDLGQLVVQGEASAEDLAEAWTNLFFQYCDEVEAHETIYRARLIAEITLCKQRNNIITDWIKILELHHIETLTEGIKSMGYDYEFNPNDAEQYAADLKRLQSEINFSKLQVRIKEAELSAILENQSSKDSVDEKYFSTIFFRINNYAKREAVNGQTTVQNYCAALRDFVAANKTTVN